MSNNPLAKVIRNAFIKNVVQQQPTNNRESFSRNTIGNILRHKRISLFEQAINKFITGAGEAPIPATSQFLDEKNLLTFSLQLSGYIRDAQKELSGLQTAQACDPGLIMLYRAAAKYSADCSNKIDGSKYVFREHCDYNVWKIDFTPSLATATFAEGQQIDPHRHNLFLFMPFHIKGEQQELQKWSSKYLSEALNNPLIFGSRVDVWLIHFPIEQPRGEKFALSLETIRNPSTYFDNVDMRFVKQHIAQFLGTDIIIDNYNHITSGQPHDNETFKLFCRNITNLGYCAGGAHAMRCFNAFTYAASQIYDASTIKESLQNIYNINYAFLPPHQNPPSPGIYFMSNYADDSLRKEPFIKMFNPELYEAAKYRPSNSAVRISSLPDGQSHIIAFRLAENFAILDSNGQKQILPDLENGHHMAVVTARNAYPADNYQQNFFTTVLKNAALGRRGQDVFRIHEANFPISDRQIPFIFQRGQSSRH